MNFTDDAFRLMEADEAEEPAHNEELEDEDSDQSSDDSSSDESDSRMHDAEDETYVRFVRSVFCDDFSGCSNTDDDDEESYAPDPRDGDDFSDDDGDRDLVRVQNRELRELVDGCWQTIIGEAPLLGASVKSEDVDNVGSPQKRRASSALRSSSEHVSTNTQNIDENGVPLVGQFNSTADNLYDELEEDLDLSLLSPIGSPVKSNGTAISNNHKAKASNTGAASGTNVISNMVTKLFSENETSEVCIEGGLPVHAVRKMVARQMSMATQLLVQILLQADERSECFTKGYTSLMELSNLREAALKKATLVEMNYKNATAIRNHTMDLQLAKQRDASLSALMGSDRSDYNEYDGDSGSDAEASDSNSSSLAVRKNGAGGRSNGKDAFVENINNVARRLTRSAMLKSIAVHTVFNVPILAKVSTLFDMIDVSRRRIKVEVANSSSQGGRTLTEINSAQVRVCTLHAIKGQVYQIMPQLRMRPWRCLLPNAHYPLPANLVRCLDATTLMGRCLFTPAEDDLLLRGIMNVGETNWEQVRAQFVPSKEAQLLQFRYSQMTSLSATLDDNNFKRYQALAVAYRNRDTKWSNEEELDLLRAYQVFGERWPLVKVFFVPHRKTTQIRFKWSALQKVWQKAFQGQSTYKVGLKRDFTPGMRAFLEMLNPLPEPAAVSDPAPVLTPVSSAVAPIGVSQNGSALAGAQAGTGGSGVPLTSNGMPLLPPPPQIAFVPPYLGPPTGATATTGSGLPPGPAPPAPPAARPMPGMAMHQAMPPSMLPFSMPFMMPPFMQQPAKLPTSPAEFMQYQQQQYFQYQQYMYQMFMMQQQSQFQFAQGPYAVMGGPGAGLVGLPAQPTGAVVPIPLPLPITEAPIGSVSSVQAKALAAPQAIQAAPVETAPAEFAIDGPLLLKDVPSGKASKRTRKFNQLDSSPSASQSQTATDAAQDHAAASSSASASLPFDENSRSVSFLHEDSLFSLLYPNDGGVFGAGADSIPYIGADSRAAHSRSTAPVAITSIAKASNKNTGTIDKAAAKKTVIAAPPLPNTAPRQPPGATQPALKGILTNKPEKKKIKPDLIASSAAAVTAGGAAFQTNKPTTPAATVSTKPAEQKSIAPVAAPVPVPACDPQAEYIELDGRSLLGMDGLSYLWRDADSEGSSSLSMSMHPSMLGEVSMMDASKFMFSNFGHPAGQSHQPYEAHTASQPTATSSAGQKKSSKNGGTSVASKESRCTAVFASPTKKASEFSGLNIDETSNMSLLGDFFNDGEIAGTSSSFSHLSQLASLAHGQLHPSTAASGPKGSSRSSNAGDRGTKQKDKNIKKTASTGRSANSEPSGTADKGDKKRTSLGNVRPFQNIAAMSTGLVSGATPRASYFAGIGDRYSPNGGVKPVSQAQSSQGTQGPQLDGPVPKKPKLGLFAEVMAKSQSSQK